MSESLRVTHVVLSLDTGGLERAVLSLTGAGRGLGQHVSVLCLERPGTLAPQAEAMGVPLACVSKPPGLGGRRRPASGRSSAGSARTWCTPTR